MSCSFPPTLPYATYAPTPLLQPSNHPHLSFLPIVQPHARTYQGIRRQHDPRGADAPSPAREEGGLVGEDGRRLDDGDAPDLPPHVHFHGQLCLFFILRGGGVGVSDVFLFFWWDVGVLGWSLEGINFNVITASQSYMYMYT